MPASKLIKFAAVSAFLAAASLNAEVRVLKNFTLIDGTGRAPVAGSAMIIDNGRITWVGPVAQLKAPAGAETSDLTGKFVMPGIIDVHVHLGATVDMVQDAKNQTPENFEKFLKTYASYGVTTVLSMGTDPDFVFKMRDDQRAGRPSEARIYTAGQGLVFKGGYGGLAGVNVPIATVAEVEPAVAAQAAKKVDVVKFWMDNELGNYPKMPYEMTQAIISAAKKHGLRTLAHIFYLEDAKKLTDQGIAGFVHMVRDKPVDQELLDAMKKHGTWQEAATLSREESMYAYDKTPSFIGDPFFLRGASLASVKVLMDPAHQKTMAATPHYDQFPGFAVMAKQNFKKEVDAGIKYAMGTDTGPPGRFPGYGDHWELQAMVDAGLTPMQVIVAATRSGAEFLNATKDLGTLEKSKWADLLVLDANPVENIRNTRTIRTVYISGKPIQ
jgi:imidazolonepropionase-like amidohydrolase